jgi:hypothetical protein
MGILLPKLTQEEIDESINEFVFHMVYCDIEKKENLNVEQQLKYDEWEKSQV